MKQRLREWLEETHGTRFELLRHSLARFFDSDLVATPGEWTKVAAGAVAVIVSAWLLLGQLLAFKYGELIRHNLAQRYREEILADEMTLVALTMSVTVLVVALLWQTLYPTLRDYLALASLPIRPGEIFAAKFTALALVCLVFVVLLTLPMAIIFHSLTAGPWKRYPSEIANIASTFGTMAGCSVFVFFSLIALQGLLLNLMPARVFERASVCLQALLVASSLGSFSFLAGKTPALARHLDFSATAIFLAAVVSPLAAIVMYSLSYRRYRVLLLETTPSRSRLRMNVPVDLWIKDPREQAAFTFIWKTLARSRVHRLPVLVYAGLGIAWVVQGDGDQFLSMCAPLMLALVMLFGLRYLFTLPADLRGNWMFQITEREGRMAWLNATERFVVWCGVAPVLVVGAMFVARRGEVLFAIGWLVLAFLLGVIAFEHLFRDWRKLPFTCSYLPGKRPLIITVALCVALMPLVVPVGWVVYHGASNPASFVVILSIELVLWWRLRRRRLKNWGVVPLRYEEQPQSEVDTFHFSDEGTTLAQEQFQREWDDFIRSGPDVPLVRPLEAGELWRERFGEWLKAIPQDLRYATRVLVKSPGFALTSILTLGLGLGLNAAFFTVFHALVLKPLAVRDPSSLASVEFRTKENQPVFLSLAEFEGLGRPGRAFSETCGSAWLVTGIESRPAKGALVTGNYFRMLGVKTALGRAIEVEDSTPVLVLSHQIWWNRFGSDASIIGRKMMVSGHPFEVIGVAGPSFGGIGRGGEKGGVDFWAPLQVWNQLPGFDRKLISVAAGRLRAGVTEHQAEAMLTAAVRQTTVQRDADQQAFRAVVESMAIPITWTALQSFLPLLFAFALTMAIPCANTANMMLARTIVRQREIGVRLTLGASRGRVVRQLLTEGFVIALLACIAGLALARVALQFALWLIHATAPPAVWMAFRIPELTLDARVVLYMLAVAGVTTVVFALAPAAQATRMAATLGVRGASFSLGASRMRDALVVGQVSVCVMLLVAAGILLRGTEKLASVELGYNAHGVFAAAFQTSPPAMELAAVLEREAWVNTLAFASRPPTDMRTLRVTAADERTQTVLYNLVSQDFFALMQIRLARGRNFTREEAISNAAVAVVSETAAKQLWPGAEPIGKTIAIEERTSEWRPRVTHAAVIGVSKDLVVSAIGGPTRASIHFPAALEKGRVMIPMVRGGGEPEQTRHLLEAAISRTSGAHLGGRVVALQDMVDWDTYPQRAASWLSAILGGLALLLTITGMYGVMSYLVSQRTKEIGIRMAMGATRMQVVRFVLTYSTKLAAAGLGFGAILALGLSKYFSSTLGTMINVFDVPAYSVSLAAVGVAALVAALGPAGRASKVDPVHSLRAD